MSNSSFATALTCACVDDRSKRAMNTAMYEAEQWMKRRVPGSSAARCAQFVRETAQLINKVHANELFDGEWLKPHVKKTAEIVANLRALRGSGTDQILITSAIASALSVDYTSDYNGEDNDYDDDDDDDVQKLSENFDSALQVDDAMPAEVHFFDRFSSLFSSSEKRRLRGFVTREKRDRDELLIRAKQWWTGLLTNERLGEQIVRATAHEMERLQYSIQRGNFWTVTKSVRAGQTKNAALLVIHEMIRNLLSSLPTGNGAWDKERDRLEAFNKVVHDLADVQDSAALGSTILSVLKDRITEIKIQWGIAIGVPKTSAKTDLSSAQWERIDKPVTSPMKREFWWTDSKEKQQEEQKKKESFYEDEIARERQDSQTLYNESLGTAQSALQTLALSVSTKDEDDEEEDDGGGGGENENAQKKTNGDEVDDIDDDDAKEPAYLMD